MLKHNLPPLTPISKIPKEDILDSLETGMLGSMSGFRLIEANPKRDLDKRQYRKYKKMSRRGHVE
jgi:hypothetical protein